MGISIHRKLPGGRVLGAALPLAACALAVLAAGCGYALVGRASNLPADVKSVYLAPLDNATPRSQVEQFLTQSIAQELVRRQRFALVDSPADADAEILGTVTAFAVTPVAFNAEGRAEQYEIRITARMIFRRVLEPGQSEDEAEVIWKNDQYLFRESYEVDVAESGYFDAEDEAIRDVADSFAETMVSDLLEGF